MGILDKKECFGSQGNDMLYGDSPDKCLDCDLFEKCHKITVSVSLQSISTAMDLFIQNGLTSGSFKGFQELEKINELKLKKAPERDN